MPKLAKFIPKRINKDIDPGAIDRGGDRLLLPGDLLDAVNCRYRNGVVKSIPGTVEKATEALGGTSKVTGVITNERDNTIIYFVWNSGREYRVYEYNPIADTITTLLTSSFADFLLGKGLLFSETARIHGGVIDGFLLFNDGERRMRKINLARARTGGYTTPYDERQLTLHAYAPIEAATCAQITDVAKEYNYVSDNNWQFAYRYVYQDNEETVFSMWSLPVYGKTIPDPTDSTDNGIRVTVPFDTALAGLVKRIDVVFRAGNDGDAYIFKKIESPTLASYDVDFFNDDFALAVPKKRQVQMYDNIPPNADAIEIIHNRAFFPLNNVGFDVDESEFDLTISLKEITNADIEDAEPFFKQGSIHGVGIVFFEGYHIHSFVKKKKFITIPRRDIETDTLIFKPSSVTHQIDWALSGTPPERATRYAIVVTKDPYFTAYAQCLVRPFKYVRDIGEGETDNRVAEMNGSEAKYYNWKGKRFAALDAEEFTARLYLQLPANLPFAPEAGDFVRVLNTDFPDQNLYIYDVVGDFIDVGLARFGSTYDLSPWLNMMIEVYRPTKQRSSEIFYEVGEIYDIPPEHTFPTTSGTIKGDTHAVKLKSQIGASLSNLQYYLYDFIPLLQEPDPSTDLVIIPQGGAATVMGYEQIIETPVKIMSPTTQLVNTTTGMRVNVEDPTFSDTIKGIFKPGPVVKDLITTELLNANKRVGVYSFDYSKIAGPYGRPHTSNENEKNLDLDTTLGFTEPYVQDSFVNGLNVVHADQTYSIPVDRGRIRALKRAGNRLIAIHENNTSTLYIGEGLIREGANFLLAKTENVVGDDRKLRGGYGTINPESVIEVYDDLYWWDALNGAIVRNTNAGNFPISNYGMHDYFLAKARELLPYKDDVRVATAYDYENDELLITFQDVLDEEDDVVVAGETWAFSTRDNEWKTRYSFIPEAYGTLKTGLYSFKYATLWKHGLNATRNNFYGTQYQRTFKGVVNPQPGKNKRLLNVHIKGDLCADTAADDFSPVRVYTPEGQQSHTPANEFELDEGKWCGPVLKDINTPNIPANQLALRSGDDIASNYFEIEVINDRTDDAPCSQVNIIYNDEEFSI